MVAEENDYKDVDNMGYKDVKIQIKSDQEPSIVAVQEYMRLNRIATTIPINSPVGGIRMQWTRRKRRQKSKGKDKDFNGAIGRGDRRKGDEKFDHNPLDGPVGWRIYHQLCPRVRPQNTLRTIERRTMQSTTRNDWRNCIVFNTKNSSVVDGASAAENEFGIVAWSY